MKYLILGSSGQVGYELTNYLREVGHDVVEFDIENNSNQDLRVPNILDSHLQDCDFVMFLAFDVGGSRYLSKYQHTYEFINNNAKLMVNTFESIKKYGRPFIFASSQMSNMSYSPYGVCKSLGELYTKSLGGIIVKFWNVYGEEHNIEKSHVITDFILMAKSGTINMLTDGTEERQFLHAEDCSRCLLKLSELYDEIDRNQNLHITSFKWNTILDVANIISKRIPCNVNPSKNIDTVQLNKRNEPDNYILNFWSPEISLDEGINKVINTMI